jgi:hypothetical protein
MLIGTRETVLQEASWIFFCVIKYWVVLTCLLFGKNFKYANTDLLLISVFVFRNIDQTLQIRTNIKFPPLTSQYVQ